MVRPGRGERVEPAVSGSEAPHAPGLCTVAPSLSHFQFSLVSAYLSPSVTCWDHLTAVHPAPPCPSLFLLLLPTVPHSPGRTSWFLCLSPWNVRTLKLEIFTLCPLLHPEGAQ